MRAQLAIGGELDIVTPGELHGALDPLHRRMDMLDRRPRPPIHDTLYPTEIRAMSAAGPNICWFAGPTVGQLWNVTGVIWVAGDDHTAVGGASIISAVGGAAPPAGSDFSASFSTQSQLQSIDFTLTTSATVANRTVVVIIDDGANVLWKWVSPVVQTASQTIEYVGGLGAVEYAAARSGVIGFALPNLTAGQFYRIRSAVINLQAGDQFAAAPRLGYVQTSPAGTVAVYKASGAQGSGLSAAQLLAPGGAPIPGAYYPPRLAVWLHPMDGLVLAFYNVANTTPLYAVVLVDKYMAMDAEPSRLP